MFSFLKDHPFAVEAFFESSLVLTYAAPIDEIARLIPDCLEVDAFQERYGFVAAAMVETKCLRPKGAPRFLGNDFFLIGYRVFVRFTGEDGKRVRGLYILGSATNKRRMQFFGNIFTHYNYTTTDIEVVDENARTEIASRLSDFTVVYEQPNGVDVPLPADSPFSTWKEARAFAGPMPFTFTHQTGSDHVLIIEGVRQDWKPQPVKVVEHRFGFLGGLGLSEMQLANAFLVSQVPYLWKSGRKVKVPR